MDHEFHAKSALTIRPSGQTRPSPSLMSGIDDKLAERVMAAGMKQGPVYSQTQMWAQLGTAAIGGIFKGMAAEKKGEILQRLSTAMEGAGLGSGDEKMVKALLQAGEVSSAVQLVEQAKRRMATSAAATAKSASQERIAAAKRADEPPTTRKFTVEDKRGRQRIITKEWDRENRVWKQIYSAPRFPEKGTRTPLQNDLIAAGMVPGSPEMNKALMSAHSGKYTSVESDGKGGFRFMTGTGKPGPSIWDKTVITKIQGKRLEASENLRGLMSIRASFDPKFLTYGSRSQAWVMNVLDKFNYNMSAYDREHLGESSVFKRNAYAALNLYIRSITGAQMSEGEAERLKMAFVDPESDGPTRFKFKLDDLIKTTRESVARLYYIEKMGIVIEEKGLVWKGRDKKGRVVSLPGIHNGSPKYRSPMSLIMEKKYQSNLATMIKLRPKTDINKLKDLATESTMNYFGLMVGG